MRSRWRAVAFICVFAASVVLGLVWHLNSKLPDSPDAAKSSGYILDVFVENPKSLVTFKLIVDPGDSRSGAFGRIFVDTHPVSPVLIYTNEDLEITPRDRANRTTVIEPYRDDVGFSFATISGPNERLPNNAEAHPDAQSFVPLSTYSVEHHAVEVRMPDIAGDESGYQGTPAAVMTNGVTTNITSGVTTKTKNLATVANSGAAGVQTAGRKGGAQRFWEPKKLRVIETATYAGEYLSNSDIKVDLPSTGTAQGNDFVWTGSYGLQGVLSATDRNVEEDANRNEFLSGIALATAAAALLALLPELPDRWKPTLSSRAISRFRGRRKAKQGVAETPPSWDTVERALSGHLYHDSD